MTNHEQLRLKYFHISMDNVPEEDRASLKEARHLHKKQYNIEAAAKHYEANKQSVRSYRNQWKLDNLDQWKVYQRRHKLKKNYGLTVDDWYELLESQGGVCAICGIDKPGHGTNWCVDHCHETGKVRGILCHACNVGLGNFKDNPDTIAAAFAYLTIDEASR